MKSFNDISMKILFALFILFLIEVIYIYYKEESLESKYDLNNDGIITKDEIVEVVLNEINKKNKKLSIDDIIKCTVSGALRGMITGALVGGAEGAVTGALVMAIINPIVSGIERTL